MEHVFSRLGALQHALMGNVVQFLKGRPLRGRAQNVVVVGVDDPHQQGQLIRRGKHQTGLKEIIQSEAIRIADADGIGNVGTGGDDLLPIISLDGDVSLLIFVIDGEYVYILAHIGLESDGAAVGLSVLYDLDGKNHDRSQQ